MLSHNCFWKEGLLKGEPMAKTQEYLVSSMSYKDLRIFTINFLSLLSSEAVMANN